MATSDQPNDELNNSIDPAQLGADQAPATRPEDDPRDMSTVLANAGDSPTGKGPQSQVQDTELGADATPTGQGSEFDNLRRRGAEGSGDNSGAVGRGEGMGRAGFNGDEDRGYDQSGYRGGLGTSGGREDLADRNFDTDQNPYTGGYGGGDYDRPDESQTQNLGLNSRNPTDDAGA
jgi:hypothetical protein